MLTFPRLFNNSSHIEPADIASMARWDAWGIAGNMDVNADGTPNTSALRARCQSLHAVNSATKLLVYADSITAPNYEGFLGVKADPSWILKDSHGVPIVYGANPLMNASDLCPLVNGQRWTDALAAAVNATFWQQDIGDGVQFDDFDLERIMRYADVDLDNNGVNDMTEHGLPWIVQHWQAGLQNLAARSRALMGPYAVIIGNGDADTRAWSNGRNNEGWNAPADVVTGTWDGSWPNWRAAFTDYLGWTATHYGDLYSQVSHPEHNVALDDYASFRFYLTTALMGDGLFSWYTAWDQANWFDEYAVNRSVAVSDGTGRGYLGAALGPYRAFGNGVLRRDFAAGIALCNPTGQAQTIALETTYRHLWGMQDNAVNSGAKVRAVTISAGNTAAGLVGDGVILLRGRRR